MDMLFLTSCVHIRGTRKRNYTMAYDHNMINNYDHLQDKGTPAHLGSRNSEPHHAGGNANWSVGAGKPTKLEKGAPKGMDM
jgi:hypothetical protein